MQTDGNAMFELRPLTDDQVVSKLQRLSTYGTDDWLAVCVSQVSRVAECIPKNLLIQPVELASVGTVKFIHLSLTSSHTGH